MKTIRDAVIDLNGKVPERTFSERTPNNYYISTNCICLNGEVVCHITDFIEQAKRLGYINGYRWGVEYPTNGKRPELADDVIVSTKCNDNRGWLPETICFNRDWRWPTHFKITDLRYKPADTSYLDVKQKDHIVEANEKVYNSWHERGELPPVGVECEVYFDTDHYPEWHSGTVTYRSDKFTIIIYADGDERCYEPEELEDAKFRPIRTHREKVIEAAENGMLTSRVSNAQRKTIKRLYDLGMLVLPPKKSDTED